MDRRAALAWCGTAAAATLADARPASAWTTSRDLSRHLFDLAADHGLQPGDYFKLASRQGVSRAVVALLRDVSVGRIDPETTGVHVGRKRFDVRSATATVAADLEGEALLARLAPGDPAYRDLLAIRRRYDRVREAGGWPRAPRLGNWDLAQLRLRLQLEGDLDGAEATRDAVTTGLRRFQARHGLVPDGVLGRATRAILTFPVDEAIAAIDRELERRRWDWPEDPTRIEINVPDFRLTFVRQGRTVVQSRVIVGALEAATPIFTTSVRAVHLHPTWNVPASLVPEVLAKGEAWLRRNRFVRTNGRLQQLPGPTNALGVIRFHTGDPRNIYLHDSPHRRLFERPARVFSAGCVRVDRFRDLAAALIEDESWSDTRLDKALLGKQPARIDLPRPVVVRIDYRTAWVADGRLQRRADYYGHDRKLADAMGQDWANDLPWGTDPDGPPLAHWAGGDAADLDDSTLAWGG